MSRAKVCKESDEAKKSIKWGPESIQTFLETYENYDVLWNVRHVDYANKAKRESCILKLKDELISLGVIVPDVGFLRARIKTIKTTYRNELLKVIETTTSGAGTDDVYVPKLPWFKTADSFLNSVAVTRQSQSNLKSGAAEGDVLADFNNSEQNDQTNMDVDDLQVARSPCAAGSLVQETPFLAGTSAQEPQFATPSCKKRRVTKLSKVESAINKLQKIAESRRSSSSSEEFDEYEVFGKHIASQLKTLPARSFVILQEKFQSLITKERLKYMTDSPMISGSPYDSTSSYVSEDEVGHQRVEEDFFEHGDMIYRNLN